MFYFFAYCFLSCLFLIENFNYVRLYFIVRKEGKSLKGRLVREKYYRKYGATSYHSPVYLLQQKEKLEMEIFSTKLFLLLFRRKLGSQNSLIYSKKNNKLVDSSMLQVVFCISMILSVILVGGILFVFFFN